MFKQVERYYYYDELSRTIYHSEKLVEDRPDLIFLGSSLNPNERMAVATFAKNLDREFGYNIKPLL